jgi:hypothetical protein
MERVNKKINAQHFFFHIIAKKTIDFIYLYFYVRICFFFHTKTQFFALVIYIMYFFLLYRVYYLYIIYLLKYIYIFFLLNFDSKKNH